jgi:DNA (cytosine-5)-methyltransferase 1
VPFKFIDLFAGIGGFHAALRALGGECVYSVEIDEEASQIYEKNWGHSPKGDITVDVSDTTMKVPNHDVLVAGFPCQPFSKSGAQKGMEETRGTLYWNILKIIEQHEPALVLLENVRNLAGPRHVHEWQLIITTLREAGYRVSYDPVVFSPHLLPRSLGGRPQVRERVFIGAVRDRSGEDLLDLNIPPILEHGPVDGWNPKDWHLESDLPLSNDVPDGTSLSETEVYWIDAWNDFVVGMWEEREGVQLPGFPLWGDSWVLPKDLEIPEGTPKWKENFLNKNADFYKEHQDFIDAWIRKWDFRSNRFPASRRKLEWQAQNTPSLWETIMHFRPSGIRAKKANYVPALVAITQTSIIGKYKRKLSPREAARLQGLPDWYTFGDQKHSATYKQLGNGVNVGVVWYVLRTAVITYSHILEKSCPELVRSVLDAPLNPDTALEKLRTSMAT